MSDILDDYREWLGNQSDRVRTHYDRCHISHDECMVARLADEITRLRDEVERLRLTEAERAFFELHIERVRWWAHSSRESEAELATVSAMFARLGGDQCHE